MGKIPAFGTFDYASPGQSDQFVKTFKELLDSVWLKHDHRDAIARQLENGKPFDIKKKMTKAPATKKDGLEDNTGEYDLSKEMLWNIDMDIYARRRNDLVKNSPRAYIEIKQKSTPLSRTKVESQIGYMAMNEVEGSGKLLELIQGITYKFEGGNKKTLALYRPKKALCNFTQQKGMKLNL